MNGTTVVDNANPENLKAMFEVTKECWIYGWQPSINGPFPTCFQPDANPPKTNKQVELVVLGLLGGLSALIIQNSSHF